MNNSIIDQIRLIAKKKILFLPHAVSQMNRPDRMISTNEVRYVVEHGVIIEDYPNDPRGHSCLMLGTGNFNRKIHIVCSPKDDYLALITAYLPDPNEWDEECKARKK